jgi:type I restriction enzyme S subunit
LAMSSDLPEGWSISSLGEMAVINMGQSPPSSEVNDSGDGLPFIQGNAEFGARFPSPRLFCKDCPKTVGAGDILLSVRAPVGELNVAPERLCIGRGLAGLRSINGNQDFFYYALGGLAPAFARLSQGSTFDAINGKDLRGIPLILPPLDEQRRIAEVLRSVDEAIAAARDVVDQATSNLEAATSALTWGNSSSSSWRHGRCDSFFVLQRGFDITEVQATPGPYRVISSSGPSYSHSAFAVEGPAVITGRKGRLGTVFYSDDACWPHDTVLWVKDFKGNHPRFVYWKLRQMDLKAYDAATSVPTLNRNNVHALEIAFPSLAEQIDISETLDAMLLAIERAEGQLLAQQAIKASVSSNLLSGHVRVPA